MRKERGRDEEKIEEGAEQRRGNTEDKKRVREKMKQMRKDGGKEVHGRFKER